MAAPVWVLSVDLQTKTATFQTGMADAARSAKGAFKDIKEGAKEAASETGYSMTEARHGVMMLGEEFGIHLPRGITTFIASIGPVGAAMEAAFPFLAIIVGATLLLEHLAKVREEAEKLTEAQGHFQEATQNAFNALDEKIISAEKRADELRGDHLGALRKELELIDRASMSELVHSFETVAKAADAVFGELKSSWYQFGIGSAGAKHALDDFQHQYDLLLEKGKDKEAADLLKGTRESAEHVLQLQKQAAESGKRIEGSGGMDPEGAALFERSRAELKKAGVGYTEKEVQAQEALVDALRSQMEIQERVNSLKTLDKSNARTETGNKIDNDQAAVDRANAAQQKAEMEQQQKEWEANYRAALQRLQESEREKIDATEKGSAERLQAIDAAIKEEERYGLQETGFYQGLKTARVSLVREMTDEENKEREEAGKEAAALSQKMAELDLAAAKEKQQLMDSARHMTDQQRVSEEVQLANEDYQIKLAGYEKEIAALDKHGKDYANKLKAIQDKEVELTKEHENTITAIKDKAEEERNARILAAENRMRDELSSGLASVLTRHQTFAHMMTSLGDQVAAGMLSTAIKSALAEDFGKEKEAAHAARLAYIAGMKFPFPVNIVMGPALGAMAFASVMAFEAGGLVPGVERGDVVPARLEPGEAVLPKNMTERLSRAAGTEDKPALHVQAHFSPTVHALDAEGVDRVLTKHADTFHRHFVAHVRKMNN